MYKFYFDMDGVLANFNARAPKNGFDTNHPTEQLDSATREAKKRMWHEIENTPNFWHDIPVIYGAKSMLYTAKMHGDIYILSKTPGAKNFMRGTNYVKFVADEKTEWVLRNFGYFFDKKHIIICNGNKAEFIKPTQNDILIDDRIDNIDDWVKYGGRGIHFVGSRQARANIINLYSK